MSINVHNITQKYIYMFSTLKELDYKVVLAQNICIASIAFGPEETQNIFNNLEKVYLNYPEEVAVAIAYRLADVMRATAYDAKDIDENIIYKFFVHMENLSSLNSHLLNQNILHSFKKAISFIQNLGVAVQFVQKLIASYMALQRSFVVSIIPFLYNKLCSDDYVQKPVLGTAFGSLISDSDSFVRSQAALALQYFIVYVLDKQETDRYVYTPSYIFVCYDRLVQDLCDQVRNNNVGNGVLVLKFLLHLKETHDPESREAREIKEVLPGLIKNISRGSSDRYWRIRYKTSVQMPEFFELIHRKLDIYDCAIMFRLLCEDCEQDNRIVTIYNAGKILNYLDQTTIVNIFCPTFLSRASEKENLKVKIALAAEIGAIATVLYDLKQNEDVINILKQTVSDCFKKLSADKNVEIRLTAAKYLDKVYQYINQAVANDIINYIIVNKSEKWVVKCALVECVYNLLNSHANIMPIVEDIVPMLVDDAFKTRQLVARMIANAAVNYGIDYMSSAMEKVIKYAKGNTSNYQNRVTCCMCLCGVLGAYLKHKQAAGLSEIDAVLTSYCSDRSVFVRQQVVQGIRELLMYAADYEDYEIFGDVKNILNRLLTTLRTDESKEIQEDAEELVETLEYFE